MIFKKKCAACSTASSASRQAASAPISRNSLNATAILMLPTSDFLRRKKRTASVDLRFLVPLIKLIKLLKTMLAGKRTMKSLISLIIVSLALVSCATSPAVEGDPCPSADAALRRSSCVAITNRPPLFGMFAWAEGGKKWKQPVVTVSFIGGTATQRRLATDRFKIVDAAAPGLSFKFVPSGGNIRVGFGCSGHWSYVGTDAIRQPATKQTMNIELRSNDTWREWDRVGIHEILHAIGFGHEHQHPTADIPWNRAAVIEFYQRTQGWSESEIEYQVLRKATPSKLITTGFYLNSIMEYPIPPELTDGKVSVGWNYIFTKEDRQLVALMYP